MALVQEVERKDAVLLAMSDEYMLKILCSIMSEAKSVEKISSENGIPLSTCYRRIRRASCFQVSQNRAHDNHPWRKKIRNF